MVLLGSTSDVSAKIQFCCQKYRRHPQILYSEESWALKTKLIYRHRTQRRYQSTEIDLMALSASFSILDTWTVGCYVNSLSFLSLLIYILLINFTSFPGAFWRRTQVYEWTLVMCSGPNFSMILVKYLNDVLVRMKKNILSSYGLDSFFNISNHLSPPPTFWVSI